MKGIHDVLYKDITDDTVMELLFQYWRADRSLDPGPSASLHERLLAVNDSLVARWWRGFETTIRFLSDQQTRGGVTACVYMAVRWPFAAWHGEPYDEAFHAYTAKADSVTVLSSEGDRDHWFPGVLVTTLAEHAATTLLRGVGVTAPAQARIGGGSPDSLRKWLASRQRTPGGVFADHYTAPDVCVAVHDRCAVFAGTREAIEASGLHEVDGFAWQCLTTMGAADTDVVDRYDSYPVFESAGISLVDALSEPRLEHAFDRFADERIGGLDNFQSRPDQPLILALVEATSSKTPVAVHDIVPEKPGNRSWERDNYGFGHRDGLHTFLEDGLGHAIWAYDETPDRQVWICREDDGQWLPIDQSLTPFLFEKAMTGFLVSAPATLHGMPPSSAHLSEVLSSFVPVAPRDRPLGSDGWYATPEVFAQLRRGEIWAAARTRPTLAATSLSRWGGWRWSYDQTDARNHTPTRRRRDAAT